MTVDLQGKVAIVTGGSAGIGAAISDELARSGAAVAICGRRPGPVRDAAALMQAAGYAALGIPGDVREPADVERLVAAVLSWQGQIDVLVNVAGGSFSEQLNRGPLIEARPTDLLEAYRLNAVTAWLCSSRVSRHLLERPAGGAIVNVASITAFQPEDNLAAYGASKAALVSLTRSMAAEWAPSIRVNAVAPGFIDTPRTRSRRTPERTRHLLTRTPLGRLGAPADVATATLFLCSPAASWISGVVLPVDGGYSLRPDQLAPA